MLTDYQILGIYETNDLKIIKSAFRKRAKELHPDTTENSDQLKNHLVFIQVCKAYDRLVEKRDVEDLKPINSFDIDKVEDGKSLIKHSDPAYAYYKNAMQLMSKIHPSQWNIDTSRMLNIKIVEDDKEQLIIKKKVMDLVSLFPKAYYFFSVVVHDYPSSVWYADSKEKMGIIEERIKRYKHIIESFSIWNEKESVKKEKYRYMLRENRNQYERFDSKLRKEWEEKKS
jgi:hypothetical protein